ncbi:histidine phosphatase family protein [Stackebrandtia nassauensis]|uniref:Phosphoglycerate mutase n=1 Tax=Stackebrandtia nassauensis (strain DSM 44728 / CIP 108903 / NRRL B-16338 / NBRC 102104 / LLR-40K-21) TaxID=446470 RepID=D3PYG5_STANL|nr:histidine phosphatase family protein [Stackebrandtia nassauensis]ADD41532.1 Phosphoglycerate mutase [Stackebrandtia nassauensis DSM 44728]
MPQHRLLYLVRHGAYEHDPNGSVDDGRLTDLGRQQASLLADRLAEVPFDVVHHSTALRAVQTADVLAFRFSGIPRHADELLRECIPTIPDDDVLTSSQQDFFAQLPDEVRAEGPLQAKSAVDRYTTVTDTDTTELVVSHGNLINYFVASAMDAPAHGWLRPVDYHCGLTVIRYSSDSGPRVITYNDVGHLPPELRGIDYPDPLRV